jgi:hypothetical protein
MTTEDMSSMPIPARRIRRVAKALGAFVKLVAVIKRTSCATRCLITRRISSGTRQVVCVCVDVQTAGYSNDVTLEEPPARRVVVSCADVEEGELVMRLVTPGAYIAVAVIRAVDALAEGGVDST